MRGEKLSGGFERLSLIRNRLSLSIMYRPVPSTGARLLCLLSCRGSAEKQGTPRKTIHRGLRPGQNYQGLKPSVSMP